MDRDIPIVTRWRLIDALDTAPPGALVLIVAAAGYGKSTLLRQWRSRSSRAIAMVQASADHDGNQLAIAIVEALGRALPAAAPLVERAQRTEVDWACDLLPPLLELVVHHPVTVAIDDTHVLSTASAIELLAVLARSWPAPGALVLSGRVRPPVPLVRHRADAPIVTIGPRELDFDRRELDAILQTHGLDVELERADVLELTGGWPAGIRLAAIVRGDHLGDDPLTVDRYLGTHVLGAFSSHELDYLGHLAVLAPAPVRVVDRVLQRNDTIEVLRALRQRGLPMVSMPRGPDDLVIIHALLADVLLARLERRAPGSADELIELAAREVERAGDPSYVVGLLERHGRGEEVRSMIYRHMFPLVVSGRTGELRSWLARFDQEEIEADPILVLAYANVLRPRDERVVRGLFARHAGDTTTVLPDGSTPAVACERMLVAFGLQPADPDDTAVRGGWRQTATGRRAWDLYSDDRLDEAEAALLAVRDSAHKYPVTNAVGLAKLAIIALETGRADEAERLAAEAGDIVTEERMEETALGFIVDTVQLKLARRHGDLARAEGIATGARRKMAVVGDGTMLERVSTLIEIGNLYVDLGYPSHLARSLHHEAVGIVDRWPSTARLDRQLRQLELRIDEQGTTGRAVAAAPQMLSAAELRVLRYLPSHLTLSRIAAELYVSHSTVKSQCQAIYRKLGVGNRADAVTAATHLGLLS